jgi:orotate phosphoribosyltransferase
MQMNSGLDPMDELDRAGAVLVDRHFVYASRKHGPNYINMDPLYPRVQLMMELVSRLAEPFLTEGFDTIASPATGGTALAAYTGARLFMSLMHQDLYGMDKVSVVWADKEGDDFHFTRGGFVDHLRGKRVLIVEDLLTTGGSVEKVCREVEKHGGTIVGVSAICNRGGVTAEQLGVPRLRSLAAVNFESFQREDCERCAAGVPIVEDIGHGADFKADYPGYPGGYVKLLS